MENILISDFITKEKLKEQLINSTWRPNIKTRIIRKDRKKEKRELLINLTIEDIKRLTKFKRNKKWN